MGSEKFIGIVVAPGSEHDGKRVSAKTPFLRRPRMSQAQSMIHTGRPMSETVKVDEFYWADVAAGSLQTGVWVPDGRDVAWALQQLIAGYRRPL